MLSDFDIARLGLDTGKLQPASVDVTLGRDLEFLPDVQAIDPEDPPENVKLRLEADAEFLLRPGRFLLGHTNEVITLPDDVAGSIEGRSTFGRLGLEVHSCAGFLDPGFSGQVTLEISLNPGARPLWLRPGMRIAQVVYFRLSSPALRPYGHPALGSKYQGQMGVTGARAA